MRVRTACTDDGGCAGGTRAIRPTHVGAFHLGRDFDDEAWDQEGRLLRCRRAYSDHASAAAMLLRLADGPRCTVDTDSIFDAFDRCGHPERCDPRTRARATALTAYGWPGSRAVANLNDRLRHHGLDDVHAWLDHHG